MADWPDSEREGKKKPPAQKDLTASAVSRILAITDPAFTAWIAELGKAHVNLNGERPGHSRLEGHLKRYTARNTFDYFIHKDLGSFLRRELDFYVKNEVMHLDDIESDTAPRVEQYLSKIKVIRRIAGKVIDFLAQLEDFQQKLWLKKKFVVDTQYCITLDRIPEEFYPEIVANDVQREEWVQLYAIDESKGDLTKPPYSEPVTVDFLKAHPTLMVDTRHFGEDVRKRLIDCIDNIDENIDGVLIDSENSQALALMQARYSDQIDCIYIDPPYNTDASAIDYKNGYKSSSWMSLLNDRLRLSRPVMTDSGVLIAAIDDEQYRELNFLIGENFDGRILGTIVVRANPSGRPTQTGYSVSHEYLIFAGETAKSKIGRMPPTEEQAARFSQRDAEGVFEWRNLRREGAGANRDDRRTMFYPIYLGEGTIRIPEMNWDEATESWIVKEEPEQNEQVVWPINEDGVEKRWRWEHSSVTRRVSDLCIRKDRTGKDFVYAKRRPHDDGVVSVSSWFDAKYSATEHGTAVLKALFGRSPFSYPKSIFAVQDAIYIAGGGAPNATILDYFGGSGTTGHAVVNLNRKNGGRRKFLLVEMGAHFDSVLLPRMKKITFTPHWSEGKPSAPANSDEANAGPKMLKVIRLESYEDALNNLVPRRSAQQDDLLASAEAKGADRLKEQYMLRYMLDVETRGSQSLLNVKAFADPTAYKLKVKRPGSDENSEVNVDLLETFNWLIGLTVQGIAAPQTFTAEFERDDEGRLNIKGRLRQDAVGPWWFRTVTGTTPDGRRALIIWRKLTGNPEQDNLVLDTWFTRAGYSAKDSEFGLIYVNGDNNLENLKAADDTWKVRLIEEDFHRLMFDTEGL